jgi:hypothetical protein
MKLYIAMLASCLIFFSCCDPCDNVTCMNGGVCNDGKCTCPSDYSGTYCETYTNPCSKVTCQNGGVCSNGRCICPGGYTGTYCETETTVNAGLLFWTDCTTMAYTGYITVYLDTNSANKQNSITVCHPSVPSCLSMYGAYYFVSTGNHSFKAISNANGFVWRGVVNVSGGCNKYYLHL